MAGIIDPRSPNNGKGINGMNIHTYIKYLYYNNKYKYKMILPVGYSTIPSLTETEEEAIRLLIEVGLKTNEARLLIVFFRGAEPTSRELERIADLRQPEVSIAITGLMKHKWVCVSSLITANKGRPVKIFKLTGTIDDILDDIKCGISAGHDQDVVLLSRIREIIQKNPSPDS